MKKNLPLLLFAMVVVYALIPKSSSKPLPDTSYWAFQSIDTMKYSRDLAREKADDEFFDATIQRQVGAIAATGATHIAIGTPYDEEFIPFITKWVTSARDHKLKVWFRGNFSGWEGWFGYPKITRSQHLELLKKFIVNHSDLFRDGDFFSSCPECENGGPGDPRHNGDLAGHRQFLIQESDVAKLAFKQIGINLPPVLHSMNGDVARLVMDKSTTKALGGFVVIDHYVSSPDKLASDVQSLANSSGGSVILGEFGAPIPDIHGDMTEVQQSVWLGKALLALSKVPQLVGLNYWTSVGGTTSLWNSDGTALAAVSTISSFYQPNQIKGHVTTLFGLPAINVDVSLGGKDIATDQQGRFVLPVHPDDAKQKLRISSPYFVPLTVPLDTHDQKLILRPQSVKFFIEYLLSLLKSDTF